MNNESRVTVRWTVLAGGAAALVAVGAGAAYLGLRASAPLPPPSNEQALPSGMSPPSDVVPMPGMPGMSGTTSTDVVVPLGQEAAERAGISVTTVTTGSTAGGLAAPGLVEPNTYKRVVVTPLVAGRITRVGAELGDHVRVGQTIAQVFSPELAEAQTRYISARATLEAHERELARTESLVRIGAASREELERTHAQHAAHRADVQTAASRLQLLGLSSETIEALGPGTPVDAITDVPSPITGVVTERLANVGLNVDQSTALFTVVDLSTVWVVAEIYERDFSRVRVGTAATITTTAYPDLALRGRVSYIDPQVNPDTRTAKARIEVPNAREELRLGMYVDARFEGAAESKPMIPRGAVQHVGDHTVVYLVNPTAPGTFIERVVRLGAPAGDEAPVLSGVKAGDVVVGTGSFYVRAERERLGLGPSPEAPATPASAMPASPTPVAVTPVSVSITVGTLAFEPAGVRLHAGVPARLTFLRTTDQTCATEVLFPSLGIRRALPLNEPVVIAFTPAQAGEIAFSCGMKMLKGVVVVEE